MTGFLRLDDGREIPVCDGLTIGRDAGCEVVIDDTKASRKHARIIVDRGVVEVEDLDSRNGTFLNGSKVQRRLLRDGDEVRIGTTPLTYVVAAREAAAVETPARPIAPLPAVPPPAEPAAAEPEVIEFVDEVVTVRAPQPASKPAVQSAAQPRNSAPREHRVHGVLQFHRQADASNRLDEDLSQLSGWPKSLLILLGIAFAVTCGYFAMQWSGG